MDFVLKLKQKACDIGFDFVGITDIKTPPNAKFFLEWIRQGYHGEMSYLANNVDLRINQRTLLDGAQSVLVLGLNYAQNEPEAHNQPQFASYALGDDYHDVIREKLYNLLEWIKSEVPEAQGRVCVDSAPVMERDLAQQAGIGWYGKNTCIINTKHGSYFFIASLLLNIALPIDPQAVGSCGTCTKCIDACPTGALLEPYKLDANKCISYLTIEHKSAIPESIRSQIGTWVFGCDICQDVCPFNQRRPNSPERALPTKEPRLKPSSITQNTRFDSLLQLDEDSFNQLFTKSPVKRAKYQGFMRNVCVAAGNSNDSTLLPRLENLIGHENEFISESAEWAVQQIPELSTNHFASAMSAQKVV